MSSKLKPHSFRTKTNIMSSPRYILYIHPKCITCQKLQKSLERSSFRDVFTQNVLLLEDKPKWLVGVPILADIRMGLIYKGSDCLVFLEKLAKKIDKPRFIQEKKDTEYLPKLPQKEEEEEEKIGQITDKKQKLSEDALSALMERREKQVPTSNSQQLK